MPCLVNLVDLALLLVNGLDSLLAVGLEHAGACRLLHQAQDLEGLHVEDLGDEALLDEEVGVVHVEAHGVEEVGDLLLLCRAAVDHVLGAPVGGDLAGAGEAATVPAARQLGTARAAGGRPRREYLAGDGDGVVLVVPHGAARFFAVVEHDGDGGLGDAGVPALVDELAHAGDADLGAVGKCRERG